MSLEEVLAQKKGNLNKLIQNADAAIRQEMLKYDEAEFYIHLQSECFNLYPLVVKALASLIADDRKRNIFCSIVKGHKLERLASFYHLTPKETVDIFRSTVAELRQRLNEGALTAKESAYLQLMYERDELQRKVQDHKKELQKLRLKNEDLHKEFKLLRFCQKKRREKEKQDEQKKKETHRMSVTMRCVKWLKENL